METNIRSLEHTRTNKMIQLTIKVMVITIFLGYIMIWVMMPTNTFWLHWLPRIHSATNSSYFGQQQGGNIVIYTTPILIIAIMSCIYLHLQNKLSHHQSTPNNLWGQLAIVRGPLGIISWTEVSFLIMFVALLVWSFSAYLHAMFANITTQSASKMGEKVWEVKLDSIALMLGLIGNICLSLLFFPVTRGSPVLRLLGLTSESTIKYHIWIGNLTMMFFIAHGLCYIVFWGTTHQISQMMKWEKIGISNVAGEVGLFIGIVIWLTSVSRIRRNIFELFFYSHHLYILFVVFFILHVGFSYIWISLPGFYLFLIDRILRLLQSQQKVRLVSARVLPCQVVELNFSKTRGLKYNPTSLIFVNVPSISKLQWHPFTVTSSSNFDDEKLSVVIKSKGSWSQKLYEKLSMPSPMDHLQVSVEGPYGPISTNFQQYDKLVMFSGGSGITPFISIIRELLHMENNNNNNNTPQILLIPSFKKSEDLAMLQLILPISPTTLDISRLKLQICPYVTQEIGHTTEEQHLHRTIWFKPNPLDAPISPILGQNNWIWLGMIIVFSFIISLVFIALFTRFYIYPIDKGTNMIYSYSIRSVCSMVFICTAISITVSIAFLWNKRRNLKEMGQIQITDLPSPLASPGLSSWCYNEDREMESLPYESLIGASTNVNYGERPDFKKILTKCEGSRIGVLVSGPKMMRDDVAAICSSELSKKFVFQSISFTW